MRTLSRGTSGPEVGLLRRMLNRRLRPSPNLPEVNVFGARYNGAMARIDFGPQMDAAVRAFQRSQRLVDDGVVGPRTWRALGLTMDVSRAVKLASQPSNITCYAAAATMVLGPAGSASFDPGPKPPNVKDDDHWARSFARQFSSWRLEYGMSPMPSLLAGYLASGPFWFAGNLPFPTGPSYHAVVVGSIWGDGTQDQTMLLVYDPWPPNVGEVYGIVHGDYIGRWPQAFRYTLHR